MKKRAYYSVRTGKHPTGGRLELHSVLSLFHAEYRRLSNSGYFQEYFGMYCIEEKEIAGKLGPDIGSVILLELGKSNLWPIYSCYGFYEEEDLFDIIEFLFDHVSEPMTGWDHSHADCGWHYAAFDALGGRRHFREAMNRILAKYGNGFELAHSGEVLEMGPPGTDALLEAPLPVVDSNITGRVDAAVLKFRRHRSTTEDRRDAVRDLAAVLEYMRDDLKLVLTKSDEADLFNIANNFSIRHHNSKQKTGYDTAIWLSWMFYFYLATIHAGVRMIEKAKIG